MEPTLHNNDLVLVKKYASGEIPRRGAISVLNLNQEKGGLSVKRIIGLPGDLIQIQAGIVSVNHLALQSPYIEGLPKTNGMEELRCTVPNGFLFAIGDYRNYAYVLDSRTYGPVALPSAYGIVINRLWPWPSRFSKQPTP